MGVFSKYGISWLFSLLGYMARIPPVMERKVDDCKCSHEILSKTVSMQPDLDFRAGNP